MSRPVNKSKSLISSLFQMITVSSLFFACHSKSENPLRNNPSEFEIPIKDDVNVVNDMTSSSSPPSRLNSVLPESNCLILDHNQGCLLNKSETVAESCAQYRSTLEMNQIIEEVGDIETCQSSPPHTLDLQGAESFLNYIRSRSGQSEINLASNDEQSDCALMNHIENIEGSWTTESSCFTEELNTFEDFSTAKVYSFWSIQSLMYSLISASRIDNIDFRNILLSSYLYSVDIGLNGGVSCMKFTTISNVSTPLNFAFYPGVGQIPIEMIASGNHKGKSAPWSIKVDDDNVQIETLNVSLITDDLETPVSITDLSSPQLENTMIWRIEPEPHVGQIYKVNVTWNNRDTNSERTLDLYLTFNDCGYQMPNTCDPNRSDQCTVPGNKCIFYRFPNTEEDWFCLPEGPREADEDCSNYSPACKGGMVCSGSSSSRSCRPFCSLDDSSSIACDDVCPDHYINEIASYRLGVCN
jgi:hypothetical protein